MTQRELEQLSQAQQNGVAKRVREAQQWMERPTIHYSELPRDNSGDQLASASTYYLSQVARLLAEGHEGKWALVKGEEIIGIWASRDEAVAVAIEKFLMQPVLVQQVLSRVPTVRGPLFLRLGGKCWSMDQPSNSR